MYIEQLTSALYLDSREDVDHYLEVMNDLSTEALTPARSAALLAEITKQTWRPGLVTGSGGAPAPAG